MKVLIKQRKAEKIISIKIIWSCYKTKKTLWKLHKKLIYKYITNKIKAKNTPLKYILNLIRIISNYVRLLTKIVDVFDIILEHIRIVVFKHVV